MRLCLFGVIRVRLKNMEIMWQTRPRELRGPRGRKRVKDKENERHRRHPYNHFGQYATEQPRAAMMASACDDRAEESGQATNGSPCGPSRPLRASIFEPGAVAKMQGEYRESKPYRHLVIPDLMDDNVLQGACEELKTNMQATLKETDIFKVYQTGDLANMDGLPKESKRLLPSLFSIRDSLYSLEFRKLVQSLTGSGALSGDEIDLSVNAFGHTGHLLCHDDVIGTREVSYILYLVDKDWGSGEKPDGGGLQLYPLENEGVPGVPAYAPSKTIAPKWNQMVLFSVQPGRSFHDVQEVYNEEKPRLAVSGWFHSARESEIGDWPGHVLKTATEGGAKDSAAASTLEQLKRGADAETSSSDTGAHSTFTDDFRGQEDLAELRKWVNPEYLSPFMVEQCANAFADNGSTIQLHRFLKEDMAKKIVDAAIAADRSDGLGYMEAVPFDTGVRAGWRKAGPPHRQRFLRLSGPDDGDNHAADDEVGALLRDLRDELLGSKAFKALLEKLLGRAVVVASRRQARRFRPGLDYTLATPGAAWEWKGKSRGDSKESFADAQGAAEPSNGAAVSNGAESGALAGSVPEEQGEFMVLDATLCFVDDREPYKEAAWRQDEVGGYVTYLGGDDEEEANASATDDSDRGPAAAGNGEAPSSVSKTASSASASGEKNDAAVYKADEGGSLVSVSASSNALSLVLRDDAAICSFVKYVSSAAPGSRFDVAGEYLVMCAGGEDDDSSEDVVATGTARVLETVPEEDSDDGDEEVEADRRKELGKDSDRVIKKLRPS